MSNAKTKKIPTEAEDGRPDNILLQIQERIRKTSSLPDYLGGQIIGQNHVLSPFADTVREGFCHLSEHGRTRGNFFLLGPTGTGKTELVKETAKFLYGDGARDRLLRIDMSEYSQGDDGLERLIGSPGTGGGRVGAFLDTAGEGFILYDEIEKSRPGFFTILLQQLDDARITLGNNKTCDLSRFFIVCTSNVGSDIFQNTRSLSDTRVAKAVESILKTRFSPEFVARFGQHGWGVLIFKPLTPPDLRLIARKFFRTEVERFRKLNFTAHGYSADCHEIVLAQVNSSQNGAREIRNIVKRLVQSCVHRTFRSDEKSVGRGVSGWLDCRDNEKTGLPELFLADRTEGRDYVSID